ncbi:MAG: hemolysin family protein [Chitinispirillaceae bacterium]
MEGDPAGSFYITGLIVSFILSSFFSVIKIIFSSVERSNITADDEHLRYYSSKIEDVLKNRHMVSGIASVGKTFSNVAFAILSFSYFQVLFPHAVSLQTWTVPFLFSFIVLSLFGHYIPRAFALRFYRSYSAPGYYAYKLLSWFFIPFVSLFISIHGALLKLLKYDEKLAFLSDEEKARITAQDEGEALDEEEREMIRSIFDLSETTVDEIMVPRIDIKGLDLNADIKSVLKIIREEGHSRIPVYKESIDQIVGVLYAKDIISWLSQNSFEDWDLSSLVKKCHFVPMGKKINDLMKEFKLKHLHLSIVVDEYGGTAGMVTMEDILEEIVGDIQDEYDVEEKPVVKVDSNVYLIDPHLDLHDLNEELDINIETEEADYNTLGGLIYHEYGDIPQENTQFEYSGLRLTVVKMDNQRIEKVKVEVLQRPEAHKSEPF